MPLLANIGTLARCLPGGPQSELHLLHHAALAWEGERLRWVGPERDLPTEFRGWPREDAGGRLVIPGLVDCHTHLAFAGWRADEFAERLGGKTYQEIAAAGGGILSTVRKTRAAGPQALLARCREHLAGMAALGVTSVEAKSGYGLTLEHELGLLRVYRELAAGPQRIVATLLAAHVVPPEYRERRSEYVSLIVDALIPQAAAEGLARCCDVFVEEGAFTPDEARRIFAAAARHGLRAKLHADQLSGGGGAELAAEVGALSADHLERVSDAGIARLAEAGVVAVSLPIAALYLGTTPLPARRLLDAGVRVAVATDFNPGTAPSYHLPVALTLACTLQRMRPAEALKGATCIAAQAIGLDAEVGSLEAGKSADFVVLAADSVDEWLYHLRPNAAVRTVARGRTLWQASS